MKKIIDVLSVPIQGTANMREHLAEHSPTDSALAYHKLANSIAGVVMLSGSVLLGQQIASNIDEELEHLKYLYNVETSPEALADATVTGIKHASVLTLEGLVLYAGLATAGNANAAYRRQQDPR